MNWLYWLMGIYAFFIVVGKINKNIQKKKANKAIHDKNVEDCFNRWQKYQLAAIPEGQESDKDTVIWWFEDYLTCERQPIGNLESLDDASIREWFDINIAHFGK